MRRGWEGRGGWIGRWIAEMRKRGGGREMGLSKRWEDVRIDKRVGGVRK